MFGAGWHKEQCLPADTFPSSAVLPTFLLHSHLSAVIPPVSQCTIPSFGTKQEVKTPQVPPALWSRSLKPLSGPFTPTQDGGLGAAAFAAGVGSLWILDPAWARSTRGDKGAKSSILLPLNLNFFFLVPRCTHASVPQCQV